MLNSFLASVRAFNTCFITIFFLNKHVINFTLNLQSGAIWCMFLHRCLFSFSLREILWVPTIEKNNAALIWHVLFFFFFSTICRDSMSFRYERRVDRKPGFIFCSLVCFSNHLVLLGNKKRSHRKKTLLSKHFAYCKEAIIFFLSFFLCLNWKIVCLFPSQTITISWHQLDRASG